MKVPWLIPALCLAPAFSLGQDVPVNTRQQLEMVAEANDQEPEDDAFLQQLVYWQKRPLNLNIAEGDDLRIFPFLTQIHIDYFLQYRKRLGPLIDLHELQSIPGWDIDIIRQVLPFVQVLPAGTPFQSIKARLQNGEHQVLFRTTRIVQRAAGFKKKENGYLGNPQQFLVRYQYRDPDGLQWGVTGEKDAGEPLLRKQHASPDFLSAHIFLRRMGRIKSLALGDFTVNMGQGLVHWQALAFGKGPSTMNIKRQSAVLRPYTSAGEAGFLRGLGATLQHKSLEATFFAAQQKIGANIDLNEFGEQVIRSFDISGLHRTTSELARRKNMEQKVVGGVLQYQRGMARWGINAVYYHFGQPVQKLEEPYNLFGLKGRQFFNFSTDYSFTWRNVHLFGELAANALGKKALVQGLLVSMHPKLDLAMHARFMQQGYTTVSGSAFTESTLPANEQGMYAGIQLRVHPKVHLHAYADVFRFPWLRFRVAAPSVGSDFLVQGIYQPSKGAEMYVRLRFRQKALNAELDNQLMASPIPFSQQNLRLHISKGVENWSLRSRVELTKWRQGAAPVDRGYLFFTEAQYSGSKRVEATGRLAFFKTDSYNTRLYAFESDVLYGYSIPLLSGKGLRGYLVLRGRLSKQTSLWLRVAHSYYPDVAFIGSGLNKIEEKGRTEVKTQVVVKF